MNVDLTTIIEGRQLRYVIAVAEHLSFKQAAIALGVQSSAISRSIAKLENQQLGVALFERNHSGVRLTDAGKEFTRHAQAILGEMTLACRQANAAGRGETGELRIGFYQSLSSGRFREMIARYKQDWPDVILKFTEGAPSDLLKGLHDRRLDAALLLGPTEAPGVDCLPLWTEAVHIALPNEHRLTCVPSIKWQDLQNDPFLVRGYTSGPVIYNWLAQHIARQGLAPLIFEHDVSRESLLGLVSIGLGLTIVSDAALGCRYPGVIFHPIDEPDARLSVTLAWRSENDKPALTRFVASARDWPKAEISDLPTTG